MRTLSMIFAAFLFAFSAVAADAPAIPNRADAIKAGEWVLMRHITPDGANETSKATVTAVADGKITLRHEVLDEAGAVVETNVREMNAADVQARVDDIAGKATSVTEETLVVKDRELPVVAVQWTGNGQEYKAWISDRVPVTGLAKFWTSDANIPGAEIIDYGFGE